MKFYLSALGLGLVLVMLAFDCSERSALTKAIETERSNYETLHADVTALRLQVSALAVAPSSAPDTEPRLPTLVIARVVDTMASSSGPAPAPTAAPIGQVATHPSAAAAAPVPQRPAEAFLNINSIPPSTAILDGAYLGATPKIHYSVKPGAHTVQFVSADQGVAQTMSVSVGPGETGQAVAKLGSNTPAQGRSDGF